MIQINQTTSTLEAIAALRKLADALESKEAFLYSGEISDTKRYGEQREICIGITVITESGFDI